MEACSLKHSKSLTNHETINSRTKLKQTVFTYEWQIEDFGDFLKRNYEIPSQTFSKDGCDWRLVLFVRHKYPIGAHTVASLVKMSGDNKPIGVKYTISIVSVKICKLGQSREKIFRHNNDSDECEIISHYDLIQKNLLVDNALLIRCEMDILSVETPAEGMKCSLPGQCQLVADPHKNQNLSNMNDSFSNKFYFNKLNSFNILNDSVNGFSDCAKGEIFQNDTDSINIFINDFETLYKSKCFSDVTLVCDGISITAHKVVLIARSDYFNQLFFKQGNNSIVNISDVNSVTMEAVLYYIYTGKIRPLTVNFALDLYSASKKFQLSKFQTFLFEYLKANLTVENVTEVLQACEDLNITDLKNVCLKFVNSNQSEVVQSKKWNWLIKNNPHIAGEVLLTIASFQKRNIL